MKPPRDTSLGAGLQLMQLDDFAQFSITRWKYASVMCRSAILEDFACIVAYEKLLNRKSEVPRSEVKPRVQTAAVFGTVNVIRRDCAHCVRKPPVTEEEMHQYKSTTLLAGDGAAHYMLKKRLEEDDVPELIALVAARVAHHCYQAAAVGHCAVDHGVPSPEQQFMVCAQLQSSCA